MKTETNPDALDREVALEALLFVANRVADPSFHRVSAFLYLADRLHLARYGRLISGDEYVVMEQGLVPGYGYGLMKGARFPKGSPQEQPFEVDAKVGHPVIVPHRDASLETLSDSDIECLENSIREHGARSFWELTDLTHDEAWSSTGPNGRIAAEDIARTLDNAELVLEHLRDPYP